MQGEARPGLGGSVGRAAKSTVGLRGLLLVSGCYHLGTVPVEPGVVVVAFSTHART